MKRAALDSVTKLIRTFRISTEPEPVTIPTGPLKRALRHIAAPAFGILFVLTSGGTGNAADRLISKSPPVITERGPHEQTWSTVSTYKMEDGREITSTNSYVQIATGLNRWDAEAERWVPADTEIEIINGKGVARKTQHQAIFAANVRADDGQGLIDLKTPDGARLVMQPVGIALVEAETGRSAFLSVLKDSIGVLVDRNTIVYEDAFEQFDADIRIQSRLEGLECDVVLQERIDDALIQQFGLNPDTVRVEVWHEVISRSDAIERVSPIPRKDGEFQANHNVDIGLMRIDSGDAFSLGGAERRLGNDPENEMPVAVAKELATIEGIEFLIESIPFREIERELEALPAPPQARVIDRARLEKAWAQRSVKGNRERPVSLAMNKGVDAGDRPVAKITRKERQFALSGYLIDYPTLNTSQTNYVFKGDTTYWVTGPVNLYGKTVLEGGAVIKFTNYTSLSPRLTVKGDFKCLTEPYRPAILTAEDDDSVGETIAGSDGTPTVNPFYAWYNLRFDWGATNELEVHDIITRYAHNGLGFQRAALNHIWNVQVLNCDKGIEAFHGSLNLQNVLIDNTRYAISARLGTNLRLAAEHLTVNKARELLYRGGYNSYTLYLTNSLHCAVTNDTWDGVLSDFTYAVNSADFQSVGGGGNYLADQSPYRDVGTPTLSGRMQEILKNGTTYPPHVYSHLVVGGETKLAPIVKRDIDTPDLGYHYAPLDYALSVYYITNQLTIEPGTAIGAFHSTSWYGIGVAAGAKLVAEGTPEKPITLTQYNMVQENPGSAWAASTDVATVYIWNGTVVPEVSYKFVNSSLPAGEGWHLYTAIGTDNRVIPISHSRFSSGQFITSDPSLYVTNCLFKRVAVKLYEWGGREMRFQNNTFWRGSIDWLTPGTGWLFLNNLFDGTAFSSTNGVTHDFNAYNGTQPGYQRLAQGPGNGADDIILANAMSYIAGPFGKYYHGNTNLMNEGTGLASDLGLYHFTTQPDQAKEANSVVDIGFHYPAVQKVKLVAVDHTTKGNWKGIYGGEGYNVVYDSISYPSYMSVATTGKNDWLFSSDTSLDINTLMRADSTNRLAASWYSSTSFDIELAVSDQLPHRLAVYCYGWCCQRVQKVEVMNSAGTVLYDSHTMAEFDANPKYLVWDFVGSIKLRITNLGPHNCLISGLFFGPSVAQASDQDRDGTADYLEDINGDGLVNSEESSWLSSNNGLGSPGLQLFTPIHQN